MMESQLNEKQLVNLAKQGNPAAVTEIVNLYSDKLYTLLIRLLRNKEEAEDALQETFITMIEKISTFEEQSKLYTWLYRVATNVALMKLRSKSKEQTLEIDENIISEKVTGGAISLIPPNPEKEFGKKEIKGILDEGIKLLPEIYRSAFILKDIEQLSIKETSDILGISEDNVKTRVRRARIYLREFLSERLT